MCQCMIHLHMLGTDGIGPDMDRATPGDLADPGPIEDPGHFYIGAKSESLQLSLTLAKAAAERLRDS